MGRYYYRKNIQQRTLSIQVGAEKLIAKVEKLVQHKTVIISPFFEGDSLLALVCRKTDTLRGSQERALCLGIVTS